MFPTIVHLSDNKFALKMKPRGIPFVELPLEFSRVSEGSTPQKLSMPPHLLLQLVDALEHLHKIVKLVHRDIKIKNLFAVRQKSKVNHCVLRVVSSFC